MSPCLFSRYYQCLHQKLYHLTANDYEDFVSVLVHAKTAFLWSVDGISAYNTLMQTIKR